MRYRSFTNPLQHPTAAAKQVAVNPSHNSLACNNWSRACCSEAALPTRSGLTWQGRGKAVTAHLSVEGVENGLHQQDVCPTVHQRPHLCIKKAIISRRMPFNEQISLNRRGILAELWIGLNWGISKLETSRRLSATDSLYLSAALSRDSLRLYYINGQKDASVSCLERAALHPRFKTNLLQVRYDQLLERNVAEGSVLHLPSSAARAVDNIMSAGCLDSHPYYFKASSFFSDGCDLSDYGQRGTTSTNILSWSSEFKWIWPARHSTNQNRLTMEQRENGRQRQRQRQRQGRREGGREEGARKGGRGDGKGGRGKWGGEGGWQRREEWERDPETLQKLALWHDRTARPSYRPMISQCSSAQRNFLIWT